MSLQRIGRYESEELIGVGGFASVYKAVDPRLEATVAVKVLAENWSHVPEVRKRFRNEAVLLRRLQSKYEISGFVDVFDIDETVTGQPYFVMTYADKGTLADRLETQRWTLEEAMPLVESIASSLALLHEQGLLHRDLKPSNILFRSAKYQQMARSSALLEPTERVLLGDLGMAKDLRSESATELSIAGGTDRFMAPEQRQIGASLDARVDIYAASVVVDSLIVDNNKALEAVLQRGQSPDRNDRHSSIEEWLDALAAVSKNGVANQPVKNVTNFSSEHVPKKSVRWRWVGVAVGATILVVAGALYAMRDTSRIEGPGTIEVGESVTYRADVSEDSSVRWIDWNGEIIEDEGFVVKPRLPGTLTFSLSAEGKTTERKIKVVASDGDPAIAGPTSVAIGESVTLSIADRGSGVSHYWLDAEGKRSESEQLTLTPTEQGKISITLIAVDAEGNERGDRHTIKVANG